MKHIVSILFTSSKNNFDSEVKFQGETYRISQFGANFDPALMVDLLKNFDGKCDAIAVSGFHPPVKLGRKTFYHPDSQKFIGIPQETPVLTGFTLRNTFIPWTIRESLGRRVFENQRVAFVSGLIQQTIASTLSDYTDRMLFADPLIHFKIPILLRGIRELEAYASRVQPLIQRKKLSNVFSSLSLKGIPNIGRWREFRETEILVSTSTLLERFDLSSVKGKTLVLDVLPKPLEERLKQAGVREVIDFTPDMDVMKQEPRLNYATLEALLQCARKDRERISQDDILEWIDDNAIRTRVRTLSKEDAHHHTRKFAFIIHPLSIRDLFRHPVLKPILKTRGPWEPILEKCVSHLPGIRYGRITGIKSRATGQTTEGIIYTLFETPKQMLKADPQAIYDKLVQICDHASTQGADIIGLGAFTKIVGDAGVTVAGRSSIPVTTGNSLSAAATLWAARVACQKLGFLPPFERGKRIHGWAMVIGATGSIGAVSAKLLSKVGDNLVLTGPRADKLLELKKEVEAISPGVNIKVSTDPHRYIERCDLIVISTSSTKGRVFDLMKVKPGAVVCDVSRPLSFGQEDAIKRPDILIVESGELTLPGNVDISCDIGLDESVVYACLAETALLSLEGRNETFTLSRNINYHKVNEIYDLAKKHGAELATIRGPMGIITDQEIELCREHALKAKGNTDV